MIRKLKLKVETIRVLSAIQLQAPRGADANSDGGGSCVPWDCFTFEADCYTDAVCPISGPCVTEQGSCLCFPQ